MSLQHDLQRLLILTGASLMQGRVACEVNSGDELVATEVIFAGILTELTPEEAVAVLSAFVFQVSGWTKTTPSSFALLMPSDMWLCSLCPCCTSVVGL